MKINYNPVEIDVIVFKDQDIITISGEEDTLPVVPGH